MKTAIYFIKLISAGLIALCGFVMFICGFASTSGTVTSAFWGLAIMGFGGYLVAHVLETSEFPLQVAVKQPKASKTEGVPAIDAPIAEPTEPVQPTIE